MRVSDTVLLSRKDGLSGFRAEDIHQALKGALDGATRVDILSAYYSVDYLHDLLISVGPKRSRRGCRVRLVFSGVLGSYFMEQRQELTKLRDKLLEDGFVDVEVRLFARAPLFHTKIYKIIRGSRPRWFLGSANASYAISGDNHEMMMQLDGAHVGLTGYIDAVVKAADSIDSTNMPSKARSLSEFLCTGLLAWETPRASQFPFAAFEFSSNDRQAILRHLNEGIPFLDAKASGFGFSLNKALGITAVESDADRDSGLSKRGRRSIRSYSVASSLGYWFPSVYRARIEKMSRAANDRSFARMDTLRSALDNRDDDELDQKFMQYVRGVKNLLSRPESSKESDQDISGRFRAYIERTKDRLRDNSFLRERSEVHHIDPVPALGSDQPGFERFATSFVDDLSYQISTQSTRESLIVKSFREALDLRQGFIEAYDLRERLEGFLRTTGWQEKHWIIPTRSK